ncbi:MAG: hypothetical protein RBU21_03010 [FCB group bacterium]|nr:hypothetical protein [FCB group bacterium]
MRALWVHAFSPFCRFLPVFAMFLCGDFAAAGPLVLRDSELVPGVIALLGADPPMGPVRSGTFFSVSLYLMPRGGCPSTFTRDLLVSLGDADIARVRLDLAGLKPGGLVRRTLGLYAPRGLPAGPLELRVGFLRDRAPGEMKREDWTYRRAAVCTVDVAAAEAPEDDAPQPVLIRGRPNVLRNGGFDGWDGWQADWDIVEGRGGWNRALRQHLDPRTFVEPPFALRIDFMGGQDPNYYGLACDTEVRPATRYTLSYFTRTENISSKSPPCLEVTDADRSIGFFRATPPLSQRFLGTTSWQEVSFTFSTPPETRRLRIKVRRYGSGPAEFRPERWGPIGGSVWFDSIRLTEGGH